MNESAKWSAIGATLGSVAGAAAVIVLADNQVAVAEHWAATIGAVAGGIGAAAVAFALALRKKG